MTPKLIRKGSALLGCALVSMFCNVAHADTETVTEDENSEWDQILEEAARERLRAILEENGDSTQKSKSLTEYASR